MDMLLEDYKDNNRAGPTIQEFLAEHFEGWYRLYNNQEYFPEFMARGGSYPYYYQKDGTPGSGMLLHEDPTGAQFKEHTPEMREMAMGFKAGATTAPGATNELMNMILGGCVDANIGRWIFEALGTYSYGIEETFHCAALLCKPRSPPHEGASRPHS